MAWSKSSPRDTGNCLHANKELSEEAWHKGAAHPRTYRTGEQMTHLPAEHFEKHAAHLCLLLNIEQEDNQCFRAANKWDSARFTGIFSTAGLYCSEALSCPAHLRVTHSVERFSVAGTT